MIREPALPLSPSGRSDCLQGRRLESLHVSRFVDAVNHSLAPNVTQDRDMWQPSCNQEVHKRREFPRISSRTLPVSISHLQQFWTLCLISAPTMAQSTSAQGASIFGDGQLEDFGRHWQPNVSRLFAEYQPAVSQAQKLPGVKDFVSAWLDGAVYCEERDGPDADVTEAIEETVVGIHQAKKRGNSSAKTFQYALLTHTQL